MEHIHPHLVAPSGPAANRQIGCDCCELILSQYCRIILCRKRCNLLLKMKVNSCPFQRLREENDVSLTFML